MMHQGKSVIDIAGSQNAEIRIDNLLEKFSAISIECGN